VKRAIVASIFGVSLAAAVYAGAFYATTAPGRAELCCATPELAWLTNQFKVDGAQFARISALHAVYLAQATERCKKIRSLNVALQAKMGQTGDITPEIEKGMNEMAQLRADCQREMFRHFVEVSHAMPPQEGRRYLTWVLGQTMHCPAAGDSACPVMTQ
jgi:membrane protein implicated in regulation of membrane protease activity